MGGGYTVLGLAATADGDLHVLTEDSGIMWVRRTSGGWTSPARIDSDSNWIMGSSIGVSPVGGRIALWFTRSQGSRLYVLDQGAWNSLILGSTPYTPPILGFTGTGRLRILQNATGTWPGTGTYVLYSEP